MCEYEIKRKRNVPFVDATLLGPGRMQSIVISVSVCLSVCPLAYLNKKVSYHRGTA